MSAREIIAREFDDEFCGTLDGAHFGEKCAAALTSAGYRVLSPGELDGVSLEAAAKEIERLGRNAEDTCGSRDHDVLIQCAAQGDMAVVIAAAIRALMKEQP
jgi:hypothetical protein